MLDPLTKLPIAPYLVLYIALIYPALKFSLTRGPVRTSGFHAHGNPGDHVGGMSAQATVRNANDRTINSVCVVECAEHGDVAGNLVLELNVH